MKITPKRLWTALVSVFFLLPAGVLRGAAGSAAWQAVATSPPSVGTVAPTVSPTPYDSISSPTGSALASAQAGSAQAPARAIRLLVDADGFFVDNEFSGPVVDGYTLPGAWVAPRLAYDPLPAIHLELGAYAAFFNGASRYPNYAYHDIAAWKGTQYQKGLHALPWFRADARVGCLAVTIGTLHRDTCDAGGAPRQALHGLSPVLYNAEALHSADPETGAQLQVALPSYSLDLWIDWQSFIFRLDTHQEAFTVGLTQEVLLTSPAAPAGLRLTLPVQALFQHRGGEIDDTGKGAQTFCNFAAGLRAGWQPRRGALTSFGGEALALYDTQQKRGYWPWPRGWGLWLSGGVQLWERMNCRLGYFYGRDFGSIFGSPHFATLSLRTGQSYGHAHTGYYHVDYTRPFARQFALGAHFEGYLSAPGGEGLSHSFGFGLTFRASMDFLLKRL